MYSVRHKYLTLNNGVLLIATMIAMGWVWGSLSSMQRNYSLQKSLDDKSRQLLVTELDYANSLLAQRYYQTDEYKDLAARSKLGLASAGEKVLILPAYSKDHASAELAEASKGVSVEKKSNFEQWLDFLLGENSKNIRA
jgi:hypothetical protein